MRARVKQEPVGDNLYTASIVAVKPDTGEYVLALPGSARRRVGLRRGQPDDDRGSHDRWQEAARRCCSRRRTASCTCSTRSLGELISADAVHRSELGDGRRPEDGPTESWCRRALRRTSRGISRRECRAGTAGIRMRSARSPGWSTSRRGKPISRWLARRQARAAVRWWIQPRHHDGCEGRARQVEALRSSRCHRSAESVGSGCAQGRVGIEPYTNAGPTSGVLATAGNLVFMGNGGGRSCPRMTRRAARSCGASTRRPPCSLRRLLTSSMACSTLLRASVASCRARTTSRRLTHACSCSRLVAKACCRSRNLTRRRRSIRRRRRLQRRSSRMAVISTRRIARCAMASMDSRRAAASRISRLRRCCGLRKGSISSFCSAGESSAAWGLSRRI